MIKTEIKLNIKKKLSSPKTGDFTPMFARKLWSSDVLRNSAILLRLKSQAGAFKLFKANAGGSGIRELAPLNCSINGYNIQQLKEEVHASTIYIIPMNRNLDITPIVSEANIQRNTDEVLTECLTCHSKVPLREFGDHKIRCSATHNKNDIKLFVGLLTTL